MIFLAGLVDFDDLLVRLSAFFDSSSDKLTTEMRSFESLLFLTSGIDFSSDNFLDLSELFDFDSLVDSLTSFLADLEPIETLGAVTFSSSFRS